MRFEAFQFLLLLWLMLCAVPAFAEWTEPVLVTENRGSSWHLVTDGEGGCLVVWHDEVDDDQFYVQRVSREGVRVWAQPTVIPIVNYGGLGQVVSDEAGGVILAWYMSDPGGYSIGIYAQRIDGNGTLTWNGGNPLPLNLDATVPRLVGDGAGGAVVSWMTYEQTGPDPLTGFDGWRNRVMAQRIDAGGNKLWGADGVMLVEVNNLQISNIHLLSDSNGGALCTWDTVGAQVFMQSVSETGMVKWGDAGTTVGLGAWGSWISDGQGGAYTADVSASPIRMQRVTPEGTFAWPGQGVEFASDLHGLCRLLPDGQGGVIAVWEGDGVWEECEWCYWPPYGYYIFQSNYARRYAATGEAVWERRIKLPGQFPNLFADGAGGVVSAGQVGERVKAYRYSDAGTALWSRFGADGRSSSSVFLSSAPDEFGGLFLAVKSMPESDNSLSLLHVNSLGVLGTRSESSGFGSGQKLRISSAGEGYQEQFFIYTTGELQVTDYLVGPNVVPSGLVPGDWMGTFHYDYAAGRFTGAMYIGHDPFN